MKLFFSSVFFIVGMILLVGHAQSWLGAGAYALVLLGTHGLYKALK